MGHVMTDDRGIPDRARVIYKVLSDDGKQRLRNKLLHVHTADKIEEVVREEYLMLFKDVHRKYGTQMYVAIIPGMTNKGEPLNIILYDDYIFVNSDTLEAIDDLCASMYMLGQILITLPNVVITDENSHRYHMKYLRGYWKLTSGNRKVLPICSN